LHIGLSSNILLLFDLGLGLQLSELGLSLLLCERFFLGGTFLILLLGDHLSLNLDIFLVVSLLRESLGLFLGLCLGWFGLGVSGSASEEPVDVYYVL
jgi:hypothetical protein